MIKLVTMESDTENSSYCALFFSLINDIVEKFMKENGQVIKIFSSSVIQCDDHFSNQNGIETLFGQDFVQNRTASCEYQFKKSNSAAKSLMGTLRSWEKVKPK